MLGKLIWVLMGIGLILFVVGLAFGILALWIIGLLMTVAGIVLAVRGGGVLRKDHVVDELSRRQANNGTTHQRCAAQG